MAISANVKFKGNDVKLLFVLEPIRSFLYTLNRSDSLSQATSQPASLVSQQTSLHHPLSLDECKGDDGPERSHKLITTWGAVENRRTGGCTEEQSEGG